MGPLHSKGSAHPSGCAKVMLSACASEWYCQGIPIGPLSAGLLGGVQQMEDSMLLDGKLREYQEAFQAIDTSGNGMLGALGPGSQGPSRVKNIPEFRRHSFVASMLVNPGNLTFQCSVLQHFQSSAALSPSPMKLQRLYARTSFGCRTLPSEAICGCQSFGVYSSETGDTTA